MIESITTTESINNKEVNVLINSSVDIDSLSDNLKAFITSNNSGITTGKPNTAINAALFPALDAIAETMVNALASPIQPKTNDEYNSHGFISGIPRNKTYRARLRKPRPTIRRLL